MVQRLFFKTVSITFFYDAMRGKVNVITIVGVY